MSPEKKKQAKIKAIAGSCPLTLSDRLNYLSYVYDFLKHGREHPQDWDGRRYGTLVTWAKLFADVQGWIPKPPVTITQNVVQTQNVDVKAEAEQRQRRRAVLAKMDEKGRDAVYEYIRALEGETRSSVGES